MNIANLERWGLEAWLGDLSAEALKEHLNQGIPVLAIIKLNLLETLDTNGNRNHTLVVVGYDEVSVYVNDALSSEYPRAIAWDRFLAAWDAFGNFSAIIRKT